MINHTEVYSDSPVLLECTSDLGRFSKFILYNNTPSNVIHQTKDSLMYALKGLTPGTFFTVGCQVESSKLTVYSELFITVKPNEPDVSNSSVGILIAVTVAPCLFILGLAVYCISKYRLKKKFKKVPKQDNHRFIYSSHINDKIFQPPIFGDKSSHLKLILNLDKSPNSQPPPSYSEIMNKL
ncbi:hypothetical protein Btru_065353 [Bulinus truncatus]|nr:hypothetical protein Btru_065353 [Bulinus truncatus]